MASKEHELSLRITNFLQTNYPNVIFHHDYGSGTRLTYGQAVKQKKLNPQRGYPDLFIAQSKDGYHGLFIEIKATNIYKKNGGLKKDKHVEEQQEMLLKLQKRGYRAVFGVGLQNMKEIITEYLGVGNKIKEGNDEVF